MVTSLRRFVGSLCVHACMHPVLIARAHNAFEVQRFPKPRMDSLERTEKKNNVTIMLGV